MTKSGIIRTGIGGWTFDPWDDSFYPSDLPKKRQLEYASRQMTAIEVNGTYYSSQKPATFAKWASEVPDNFVFSLKASRFCTNRKILAEAGPSVEKFLHQGIEELGPHLGPILWQFMGTKKFDAEDFAAFLGLLPKELNGLPLRHVVEPRHESFQIPEFIDMLRRYGVAAVCADHHDYPMFADPTADLVYARLQKGADETPTCYPASDLDAWSGRFETYAAGGTPEDLTLIAGDKPAEQIPRDVFAFFISGGKVNAPKGAIELQKRVG
ncbi:MAG: DUF72 domain-containing protein [Alphaproteobacteria bacterium]|nr:DUF72 domain-containing protein [Alphaproteobacteria bacterium]